MSKNKYSFGPIYCLHIKPNNHHSFIIIGAQAILLNMDLPLSRSILETFHKVLENIPLLDAIK